MHRLGRRLPRAFAAALALSLGLVTHPLAPHSAKAASRTKPIMFGATGASKGLVLDHEQVLGKKLQALRVYRDWEDQLIGSSQTWARDTGHTIVLSMKAHRSGGGYVKFADIANAQPGSRLYRDLQRQAAELRAFRAKIYFSFAPEPEAWSGVGSGGPADFVRAWRKLVSVYRAEGATNVEHVWTVTGYGFVRKDAKNAKYYYPGDAYVDHIGLDGGNYFTCRGDEDADWRELADIIEGQRQFGRAHPSKGLMVLEIGSAEDPRRPGRKAQWLRNARELFKEPGYAQYKLVMTWEGRNYNPPSGHRNACNFDYLSSSSATEAWKEWGNDPAYAARLI